MTQDRTKVDLGIPFRGCKSNSLVEMLHVYVGLLLEGVFGGFTAYMMNICTFDSLGGGGGIKH